MSSSLKYLLLACPLLVLLAAPARAEKALSPSPEQNFFYSRLQPEALNKPVAKPQAKLPTKLVVDAPVQLKDDAAKDASVKVQPAVPAQPTSFAFGPRFTLRYNTEGAGYDPFVGFEGFAPIRQVPGNSLTFLQGKLLLATPNSDLSGTVILGHRLLMGLGDRSLGGYISYDHRKTEDGSYNQLGFGLESLSARLDLRLNGYLPIGNTSRELATGFNGLAFFQGNSLQVGRTRLFQSALGGVDAEVGTKLLSLGKTGYLRGYAGAYYYTGDNVSGVVGVRGRLEARPVDQLSLDLGVQHDSQFDTRVTFGLGLSLGGAPAVGVDRSTAVARLADSVDRQPTITIAREAKNDVVPALGATNQPLNFLVVDPVRGGSGNGSFENPFATVAQARTVAQGNDVIYVRSQTGDPVPTVNASDLSNLPGISVLSNGPVQTVSTQLGQVPIPGSRSGILPVVNGTVTIASNSTLSGFNIAPTTGSGIQGTNVTGTVTLTDNIIQNTSSGTSPGISIDNDSVPVNLTIARNTVSNAAAEGIFVRSRGTAQTQALVTENTTTQTSGSGIKFFTIDNAKLRATLSNNDISQNIATIGQDGAIRVGTFNQGDVAVTVEGNRIHDNESNGFFMGTEDTSQVTAQILNNTATNNLGMGLFVGSRQASKITATVSGNTSTFNRFNPNVSPPGFPTGHGIFVGAQERGETIATISNNTVTNNEQNGIFVFVANQGKGTIDVLNNTSSNNRRNGIEVNVGLNPPPPPPNPIITAPPPVGTIQGVVKVINNTVNNNAGEGPPGQGGGGIIVLSFNNATLQTIVQGNSVSNNATASNAFAGIGLLSLDNSTIQANVNLNTLTANPPNFVPGSQNLPFGLVVEAGRPGANPGDPSPDNSKMCLNLTGNKSDTAIALLRFTGPLMYQADIAGNLGTLITVPPTPPPADAGPPLAGLSGAPFGLQKCVVP